MPTPIPQENGLRIIDSFLPSQERTPLSSGSAVFTSIKFLKAFRDGVDLAEIADIDLDDNEEWLEHAVIETLRVHIEAGASDYTSEEAVRAELPRALRINVAIALRGVISAATGARFDPLVQKIEPDDERLVRAREVLSTQEGYGRALGILNAIAEEIVVEEDPAESRLDVDYRAAQLFRTSRRFPENTTDLENRELRRRQLMGWLRRRLGAFAITSPETFETVRSLLNDELHPMFLRTSLPS